MQRNPSLEPIGSCPGMLGTSVPLTSRALLQPPTRYAPSYSLGHLAVPYGGEQDAGLEPSTYNHKNTVCSSDYTSPPISRVLEYLGILRDPPHQETQSKASKSQLMVGPTPQTEKMLLLCSAAFASAAMPRAGVIHSSSCYDNRQTIFNVLVQDLKSKRLIRRHIREYQNHKVARCGRARSVQ
jgi:hypothetical protein